MGAGTLARLCGDPPGHESLESRHGVAKRVLMLTACAPGYLLGRRISLLRRLDCRCATP